MDGLALVFGDVIVDTETGSFVGSGSGSGEGGVQSVGDHFVGAVLEGEKFARVVVAETGVYGDGDAAADGGEERFEEGFGVHVGRLDEDAALGVVDGRKPGGVLRGVHAAVVGGYTAIHDELVS